MKTIKVFLASSDELKEERTHIGDLFTHLNRIFIPRGTYLELSEWEHLDSSMGYQHKQDEYNKELGTCEMCIVMYWSKFGEYTNQEFSIAYDAVKRGVNPKKLYVFFKEPCNASAELQTFKDSFEKDYGHFYCRFETVDALKLHFVLQLESYQNSDLLSIEDSMLKLGEYEVARLSNAPFAYNNKAYKELHIRIQEVDEAIENLRTGSGEWFSKQLSLKIKEKEGLLRELNSCENSLLDTALYIARTSSQASSDKMRRAINAFNDGNIAKAREVLYDTESDAEITFKRLKESRLIYEQELLNAHNAIREMLLKASVLMADSSLPIESRVEDACKLYRRTIALAKECSYNIKDYISMLNKYGVLLKNHARYKEAYEVFIEQERLTIETFGDKDESLAGLYNNLGMVGRRYGKTQENSILYYKKSIDILGNIYGFEHTALAYTYCNLGSAYAKLSPTDINASIDMFMKALELCGDDFYDSHLIATIYNNLGYIYRNQHLYDLSLNHYLKAYKLWDKLGKQKVRYLASVYNNIGVVYRKLDNYELALENYIKALRIWENHYGYFHPNVASVYFNMALLFEESADYAKAVENYEHSYKIRCVILEENHFDTIISKTRLDNAVLLEKGSKLLSELDDDTNF